MKKNGFHSMSKFKSWISACRLRTLPLSVSGVIVGASLAYSRGVFDSAVCVLTIFTTLSLQILSNLANDYGDGIKGTDNEHRIGPERALQSGIISPKEMRNAIIFNVVICFSLVLSLIYQAFGQDQFFSSVVFVVLGILAIVAAIKYTVGSSAYGYKALGDLMVFLFFGWLSVLGSYFLYAKQIDILMLLPASSIGLLSAAVLNLNNMRDLESDKLSKKHTLAGYLGSKKSKHYHLFMVALALLLMLIYPLNNSSVSTVFLLAGCLPLFIHMYRVWHIKDPVKYDPQLKVLALSTVGMALLFMASLL